MQNKLIKKYPLLFIALAVIAGSLNSVSIKFVNESVPIFTIGAVRWLSMGIIFTVLSRGAVKHIKRDHIGDVAVQAGLNIATNLVWFGGLAYAQAINSSIMFLLNPILVYVGSVLFLREPRSTRALTGSLIAFGGGVLLFGAPAFGGATKEMVGNGLLLLATLGWAAQVLHGKKVITDDNVTAILGIRYTATGITVALLAFTFESPMIIRDIPLDAALWLVGSLLISGVWSTLTMFKGLVHVKAEDISTILYLDPLVGVIGGAVILGESLTGVAMLASGVILVGVLVSHPAHMHRMIYYRKSAHSNGEEFLHWVDKEYYHLDARIRKILRG